MDALRVVLGAGCLVLAIAQLVRVLRERRWADQHGHVKTRSLRGPILMGLFWLLLGAWWLGRGLLA
jgi:hypothetical protein